MDFAWLVPLLALITLFFVLGFALWSKNATEKRRHDSTEKSALASDGDSHSAAP